MATDLTTTKSNGEAVRERGSAGEGLRVERHFTREGVHPYDEVEWEIREASIGDGSGDKVFEQQGVEVPAFWSQMATNVVASKYFRGHVGAEGREHSARQLIDRVVDTIAGWGWRGGYFASEADRDIFAQELRHLVLHQRMAFNSPVWFNVGVEWPRPQSSACFINSVDDSLSDILELARTEGMLFKHGSGAGSNLSRVRSSRERLSGGGHASGPVSFMRGFDAFAGSIKSGGKTRRAAKMVLLDAVHPDIREFIWSKAEEEKKAWALIEQGYDPGFNVPGGAYDSVFFQNANHSVRVTDDFMEAVEQRGTWQTREVVSGEVAEELDARELFREVAEATWLCGDPGVQFDTTINRWHTSPNSGRIRASNPCVTGDTLVATATGSRRIDGLLEAKAEVVGSDGELHPIAPAFSTGTKPVYRLRTQPGYELKLTGDHLVTTANRGDVPACELTRDDRVVLMPGRFGEEVIDEGLAEYVGLMIGDGCIARSPTQDVIVLTLSPEEEAIAYRAKVAVERFLRDHIVDGRSASEINLRAPQTSLLLRLSSAPLDEFLGRYAVLDQGSEGKNITDQVFALDEATTAALLRGIFTADGTVANYGDKSKYISLDMTSLSLLKRVQLLLLNFGIKSKIYENRRANYEGTALLPDGKGGLKEYEVEQVHSLRISRSSRVVFEDKINFMTGSPKRQALRELNESVGAYADRLTAKVESLTYLGEEPVYDLTEPATNHFVANGVVVHNCSEFLFLDDTSCNLASLNLMTFREEDGQFDVDAFRHAVRLTFTAQEILVSASSYPTPAIARNSEAFRPLGLGFANLGALLMSRGLAYDSEEGRALAGAITALMCGEAYRQSAELARVKGPFAGYVANEAPMLDVIRMHRAAVDDLATCHEPIREEPLFWAAREAWDEALELGEEAGYRNAQATVLAPTGCVTEDTMLLTSKGLLPIGELGDMDGETWQALELDVVQEQEFQRATKFYVNGEDEVYELHTSRGHRIRATWKHQLRVIDAAGDYVWRKMEDIGPGDLVVLRTGGHEELMADAPLVRLLQIERPLHGNATEVALPEVLDERLAEVVGFYMGDGYLKERGGLHLVTHDTDEDVRADLTQWAESLGIKPRLEPRVGCTMLQLNSRRLRRWFKLNDFDKPTGNRGEGAEGAFIPLAVLRSRSSVLAAFLRGLFEADGTVHLLTSGSPIVSVSTVSEGLARQVMAAMNALGIRVSLDIIGPRRDSPGDRCKYRVRVASQADVQTFSDKIGFMSKRKQEVLAQGLAHVEAHGDAVRRGHNLRHAALLEEFYDASIGLPHDVRSDISVRARQGMASLDWIERHIEAHPQLRQTQVARLLEMGTLQFVEVESNELIGRLPTYDISVPVNHTYVANGFVSHNTISFLMDCDTTGVEPDIALIKYKKLVGGGYFKIVNQTVAEALVRLGYDDDTRRQILEHLMEHETIEGAPGLEEEHLPVFDCAFRPANGTRSIEPMGHVKMVAAVQPFISGAISKTINVPNDATVDDIMGLYQEAWRLGTKCVAVYRDGCKRTQPLSTSLDAGEGKKKQEEATAAVAVAAPRRRRLPDERPSITHKFSINGYEGYITVGMYHDGQPGEIFITMSKEGSVLNGLMDAFATSISLCLQYGVPLEVLTGKFSHMRFEPSGWTNNPRIRIAKSIVDYIFRWLADKFVDGEEAPAVSGHTLSDDFHVPVTQAIDATRDALDGQDGRRQRRNGGSSTADGEPAGEVDDVATGSERPQVSFALQADAPPCHVCGAIMIRNGACYKCGHCGATSGCS